MTTQLKLHELESEFSKLDYPLSRATAVQRYEGVTLLLADGEADLGDLIAETGTSEFESPDDLYTDLQNVLPVEAVGEPGQSDGDA